MAIKILRRGLPVIGYAKIGVPGRKRQDGRQAAPTKLDHIELTGRERGADGELLPDVKLMARLLESDAIPTCGGCPRSEELARTTGMPVFKRGLPRRLPIVLPFNDLDLSLPHHLTLWRGKVAWCVGDGEHAMRRPEIPVLDQRGNRKMRDGKPEVRFGPPQEHTPCGPDCELFRVRCKPFGKLRFILATQESVGGCFEFHTTSWNSLANLKESLDFIATLTGGVLAWIPLLFEVSPQTVTPMEGGPSGRAWIARVTYPGNPQQLLESVTEQLQLRAPMMGQIRQLEATIRGETPWNEAPEEIEARRAEYDPEAPEEPVAIVDVDGAPEEQAAAADGPEPAAPEEEGDDFLRDAEEPPAERAPAPERPQRGNGGRPARELSVATLPEVEAAQGADADQWQRELGWD